MRWRRITVNERRRFEYVNLVLVGRRDLTRVRAAIECRNTDVIVCSSRNDLDTLESAGEDDNIATSGVRLLVNTTNSNGIKIVIPNDTYTLLRHNKSM